MPNDTQAAIQRFLASGKQIQLIPAGKRAYTASQMREAVRAPAPRRDYLNERHTQRMSDGRVITVNGMGEPC